MRQVAFADAGEILASASLYQLGLAAARGSIPGVCVERPHGVWAPGATGAAGCRSYSVAGTVEMHPRSCAKMMLSLMTRDSRARAETTALVQARDGSGIRQTFCACCDSRSGSTTTIPNACLYRTVVSVGLGLATRRMPRWWRTLQVTVTSLLGSALRTTTRHAAAARYRVHEKRKGARVTMVAGKPRRGNSPDRDLGPTPTSRSGRRARISSPLGSR